MSGEVAASFSLRSAASLPIEGMSLAPVWE